MAQDLHMMAVPPGIKDLTKLQIYLVQITLKNKTAVVLAFDDDDAEMKRRELSPYLPEQKVEIVGPYTLLSGQL